MKVESCSAAETGARCPAPGTEIGRNERSRIVSECEERLGAQGARTHAQRASDSAEC